MTEPKIVPLAGAETEEPIARIDGSVCMTANIAAIVYDPYFEPVGVVNA